MSAESAVGIYIYLSFLTTIVCESTSWAPNSFPNRYEAPSNGFNLSIVLTRIHQNLFFLLSTKTTLLPRAHLTWSNAPYNLEQKIIDQYYTN